MLGQCIASAHDIMMLFWLIATQEVYLFGKYFFVILCSHIVNLLLPSVVPLVAELC